MNDDGPNRNDVQHTAGQWPVQKSSPEITIPEHKTPAHDFNLAEQFLHALDANTQQFTFLLVNETGHQYRKPVERHCTLAQIWPIILKLNQINDRYAVYVTINETNLKARTAKDIIRVRALFIDTDIPESAAKLAANAQLLRPSILVVRDGFHVHGYWLTDDTTLEQFNALQRALIRVFGSDGKVHDLPRVLRLPGTLHLKGEPILIRLLLRNPPPIYKTQQIIDAFGLDKLPPESAPPPHQASLPTGVTVPNINEDLSDGVSLGWFDKLSDKDRDDALRQMLRVISEVASGPRGPATYPNLPEWLDCLMAAYASGAPNAEDIAREWSKLSEDKYSNAEFDKAWRSFGGKPSGARITIGTLIKFAGERGFDRDAWRAYAYAQQAGAGANAATKNASNHTAPPEEITPYDFWPKAGAPILPEELLPKPIEAFARGAAIVVGADVGGFAIAAIAVAAAAIDDAIKLQVTPFSTWLEAARLWAALVGDPSSKKSPILNTTYEPLRQEDLKLWDIYKTKMAVWKTLPKPQRSVTPEPVCERLTIGDTTVEAAQHAFEATERGMLGIHDEMGGWFGSMDRYGSSGRNSSDRAFMLQAYNGGAYRVDRIQRGTIYLKNIGLSILGGIQPDLIRRVTDAPDDDGLVQRLTPIILRPGEVPNSNPQAADDAKSLAALIPQLLRLKPPNWRSYLGFDDKAQAIQRELSIEHRDLVKGFERVNRKLSTALGKQDGLFARLCVVWHAVEHAGGHGVTHESKVTIEHVGGLVRRPGEGPAEGFAGGGICLPPTVSESVAARVAAFMRQFIRPHLFDFYEEVLALPEEHERLRAIAGYILSKKLTTIANRQI